MPRSATMQTSPMAKRLRSSRDFRSMQDYGEFLTALVAERNATRAAKLAEERAGLRPLPVRPWPSYRELLVRVARSSTIRVVGKTCSVPSRLIGYRVRVRLYPTHLELEQAAHASSALSACKATGRTPSTTATSFTRG